MSFRYLIVAVALLLANPVYGKDRPLVRVFFTDGTQHTSEFIKYDRNKFTFEFKHQTAKEQFRLSRISAIAFDTTVTQLPPEEQSGSRLDEIQIRSGGMLALLFSAMDRDKVRFGLEVKKTKREIPTDSIRFVRFNHDILNVDRHDFGGGLNLLDSSSLEEVTNLNAQEIEQSAEFIRDSAVQRYLDSLTNFVARFSRGGRHDYTCQLINSDDVNAFTIGGGRIYIYRGLIERLGTESELAGVIAHEVGHNVGQHMSKQISKQLLYTGILGAAGAILNQDKHEWVKTLTGTGGIVAFFALMKFSRDDEREADLFATYNLYQAGINPSGMVTLFETFSKLQGGGATILDQWAATHPNPDERKENVSSEIAEIDADGMVETSDGFKWVKDYVTAMPPPLKTVVVWADSVTVGAGYSVSKLIDLTVAGVKNPVLEGKFLASGGPRNDIRFYIFDEINFINWSNGNVATPVLASEKITLYEVNFRFAKAAKYYLVFDNRDSFLTDKRVIVSLELKYNER